MDKMLGEVALVTEVKEKDLVWINDAYRAIVKTECFDNGTVKLTTMDGMEKFFLQDANVIRGHYFLVARRID